MSRGLSAPRLSDAGCSAARARRRRGQAGLTLVEIAVALGILSILFTGIFSALATANLAAQGAREHQAASEEALLRMDQYCSQDVGALLANREGYFPVLYKSGTRLDGTAKTNALVAGPAAMFDYTTQPGQAGPPPGDPGDSALDAAAVARGSVGRTRPLYVKVVQISANVVEVRVTVCWQSKDGTTPRLYLVSRVNR